MTPATCPCCESLKQRVLWTSPERDAFLFKCSNCSYIGARPIQSSSTLYDKDYYLENYQAYQEQRRPHIHKILKQFFSTTPLPQNPLCLDYGCGMGLYLEELHQLGHQVQGFDSSEAACQFIKEKGLPATSDLTTLNQSFDAVFIMDVLAHVEHPLQTLVEIQKYCTSECTIYLKTPHRSKVFEWFLKVATLRPSGGRGFIRLPYQFHHFNTLSIQALFKKAGFSKVQVQKGSEINQALKPLSFGRLFTKVYQTILRWTSGESLLVIAQK